jgi:primosomal protein N' (replication factor Y)
MDYYELSLLKSPLEPLTYQSKDDIKTGTIVEVNLKNRKNLSLAVVVKKVKQPTFRCSDRYKKKQPYFWKICCSGT